MLRNCHCKSFDKANLPALKGSFGKMSASPMFSCSNQWHYYLPICRKVISVIFCLVWRIELFCIDVNFLRSIDLSTPRGHNKPFKIFFPFVRKIMVSWASQCFLFRYFQFCSFQVCYVKKLCQWKSFDKANLPALKGSFGKMSAGPIFFFLAVINGVTIANLSKSNISNFFALFEGTELLFIDIDFLRSIDLPTLKGHNKP